MTPDKPGFFEELKRRHVVRVVITYAVARVIANLIFDPLILRYQHDPRFAAFCKKVGLPTTTDAKALP